MPRLLFMSLLPNQSLLPPLFGAPNQLLFISPFAADFRIGWRPVLFMSLLPNQSLLPLNQLLFMPWLAAISFFAARCMPIRCSDFFFNLALAFMTFDDAPTLS